MTGDAGSSPTILIFGGRSAEDRVTAAVGAIDARVDRLDDREEFGRRARRAQLVLLERAHVEEPERVRSWIDAAILDPAVPLLLLCEGSLERPAYREWLASGVWEVVREPVDPRVLALRLRNLLGTGSGQAPPASIAPGGPYPWPTLVRATEETLALGRRYGRPVSCVALAVDQAVEREPGAPGGGAARGEGRRLITRLGVAAGQWVRDSDLVGLSEQDVLLAVLPDTTGYYAGILGPRLVAALERSLRRAGAVARIRSAVREAELDAVGSASDFLHAAIREVT